MRPHICSSITLIPGISRVTCLPGWTLLGWLVSPEIQSCFKFTWLWLWNLHLWEMCYCSASVWFSPVIAWGSWNTRSSSFICRTSWLNIDLIRVPERGRTSPRLYLFAGEEGPDVQAISIDRALQKSQLNILLGKEDMEYKWSAEKTWMRI